MQLRFDFRPVTSTGERSHLEELQGLVLGKDPAPPALPLQGLRTTSMSILAYLEGRKRPVGAVTVVDTTKDALSRLIYGIPPIYGSTAFYGGMMVLPEYRGWGIPVRLIFQAQRLFVNELGIRSTWLLYPEERIAGARLTTIMKYRPLPETSTRQDAQTASSSARSPGNSASNGICCLCRMVCRPGGPRATERIRDHDASSGQRHNRSDERTARCRSARMGIRPQRAQAAGGTVFVRQRICPPSNRGRCRDRTSLCRLL